MIRLEQKKQIVSELVTLLASAQGMFFVDYSRLSVKDVTEIRKEFFQIGAVMRVAKNTLIHRAIGEIEGLELPFEYLAGQTAIIVSGEDTIAPARTIKKIFDKTEKFRLKAAIIEGQVYEGKQLNLIASLPSRAELMASLIGSLQSPITGIVGSINAVIRDISSLVEEVAKKKSA